MMAWSTPASTRVVALRRKRRQRGVVMVEYVAVLVLVLLPCVAGAVLCYGRVYTWYSHFVDQVSEPTP